MTAHSHAHGHGSPPRTDSTRLVPRSSDADDLNSLGHRYLEGVGVRRDRVLARRLFEQAAARADPLGIYNLSVCFAFGEGVRRDTRLAVALEREAARRGSRDAMTALGYRFLNGIGLRQSETEALRWYRRAARLGDASAYFSLGQYFYDRHEFTKARSPLEKGVLAGHTKCLFYLGRMMIFGLGVPLKRRAGWLLVKTAAERGHLPAQRFVKRNRPHA